MEQTRVTEHFENYYKTTNAGLLIGLGKVQKAIFFVLLICGNVNQPKIVLERCQVFLLYCWGLLWWLASPSQGPQLLSTIYNVVRPPVIKS